jgi:hypothetical protein
MPYGKCPLCGLVGHLQVGDVAAWYRERYPAQPSGSLVPLVCYLCWQEVKVGDRVVVRKLFAQDRSAQPNDRGTLERIDASSDGALYVIRLDSGREVVLIRAEFRKLRDNEV